MKPVYRFLIAGVLIGGSCNAQMEDKNFIDFSPGLGIPIGQFASKDPNSIKSGLAKNGLGFNLEYGHYFKENFGLCVGIKRNVFPLDVDQLYRSSSSITKATSDPWRLFVAYAGLARRKQVDDKLILTYKVAGGVATSRYPAATMDFASGAVYTITSNAGSAPALIVGLGLKYHYSEKVHFGLKFDYVSTSPKFDVTQVVQSGATQKRTMSHYTQNIQAITAGASVSYNF